jgi:hypothetical protein
MTDAANNEVLDTLICQIDEKLAELKTHLRLLDEKNESGSGIGLFSASEQVILTNTMQEVIRLAVIAQDAVLEQRYKAER